MTDSLLHFRPWGKLTFHWPPSKLRKLTGGKVKAESPGKERESFGSWIGEGPRKERESFSSWTGEGPGTLLGADLASYTGTLPFLGCARVYFQHYNLLSNFFCTKDHANTTPWKQHRELRVTAQAFLVWKSKAIKSQLTPHSLLQTHWLKGFSGKGVK